MTENEASQTEAQALSQGSAATTVGTESLGRSGLPGLPEILQQPAVRKAFPIIIVVSTVAVFAALFVDFDLQLSQCLSWND